MTGLQRARVAQLIVTTPSGRVRGSGYRVTTDSVLTAAHVLENAVSVEVRFSPDLPDEWAVTSTTWWIGENDIALVTIEGNPVEPALYGRVGERAAVLVVQAVGFPLWKMRDSYRDAFHANGTVAVLSNWREGTLEVSLASPPDGSWEGMSGAALFAGDRIVGVIAANYPGDGPARLTATRVDEIAQQAPDVVPEDRVVSAYREQLRETAPPQLLEREAELDELVRFCAGSEPYRWLQAGPWAGKSALLSCFVLDHLPRRVDVVSFFITSRYAGQSDSDVFIESLIEQLTALVGESPDGLLQSRARRGHLIRLLRSAAARSAESGRRLLLVVDGLDEDTSTEGGITRPSIASLLPTDPPDGLRVLVASRPHPGLPDDVSADHPLRTVAPSPLAGSPYARDIAARAKLELKAALRGSGHEHTVLGLITASGGGLTRPDIEEVTGWAPYELDSVFEGRLARSLTHRATSGMYVFSHETLREFAHHQLGPRVQDYRDQLHTWASRYQAWPATTPVYLMRGYPTMLARTGDLPHLQVLALSRARHDRLLEYSGGDALAQIEAANAIGLAARHQDIAALLMLAVIRDELVERNSLIPPELPALWIKLGEPARALALANGIANPHMRAEALIQSAGAAYKDRPDVIVRIRRDIGKIADPELRDRTMTSLVAAAADAGRHNEARELLAEIADPDRRLRAEIWCAIEAGELTEAEPLVHQIRFDSRRVHAVAEVILALTRAGNEHQAAELAHRAELGEFKKTLTSSESAEPDAELIMLAPVVLKEDPDSHRDEPMQQRYTRQLMAGARARQVTAALEAGDPMRARALATSAEQMAVRKADLDHVVSVAGHSLARELAEAAAAFGALGDFDHALRVAGKIDDAERRARTEAELAKALAVMGDRGRGVRVAGAITDAGLRALALTWVAAVHEPTDARRLAVIAEQHARQGAGSRRKGAALAGLVGPAAAAGASDLARRLATAAETQADQLPQPVERLAALRELIEAAGPVLSRPDIRRLVDATRNSEHHEVVEELRYRIRLGVNAVVAVAKAGDFEDLEQLVAVAAPLLPEVFASAAEELAVAGGNRDDAVRLLAKAEGHDHRRLGTVRITFPPSSSFVCGLIAIGDLARAETLIAQMRNDEQIEAQAALAIGLAAEGQRDRAHALTLSLPSRLTGFSYPSADRVAEALVVVGEYDAAVELARKASATGKVAVRLAEAGEHHRAEELAREITDPEGRSTALAGIAEHADEGSARRLVAEVLTSEAWRPGLRLAAKLLGPQVVKIAEFLLQ